MTQRDLATLACKIMALYFYVQAAISLVMIPIEFFVSLAQAFERGGFIGNDFSQFSVVTLVIGGGELIVGLILWLTAPRIASRMITENNSAIAIPGITLDSAMTVAFAAVGVLWLVPSLKDVAGDIFTAIRFSGMESPFWKSGAWQTSMWSALVQVALSLWLIFGSRGMVRLVKWARATAGHPRYDATADAKPADPPPSPTHLG